ncbi:glycosyltransferase family 4 protein [Flavobacterium sp. XGLA_31]|uniref:glycosyltransferase family 4 protein n=1 Tax=Flavobacterium sp. XGLA_31 TaxID=3447666 RepID=UPI003F31E432
MKILYITPKINDAGGVAKVLSIKTDYLIRQHNYTIHIVTQNDGGKDVFYDYHPNIQHHNIVLKGNPVAFLYQYKKQIERLIKVVNPEIVVLCDFGWKAFLFPFVIKTAKPVVFEVHASKFNEPVAYKNNWFNRLLHQSKYFFRNYSIRKFEALVTLSQDALAEWNADKGIVIPNPIVVNNISLPDLESKKVIAAARYSYEKGLDRLLRIWQLVIVKHPDWVLEIYGKTSDGLPLEKVAENLNIEHSVRFLTPVKNIEEKYSDASIYAMTSRSEAFAMVVLEAMCCGLPVVAFDCPVGPRALIKDKENGFLIEDDNIVAYANQLILLMDSLELRQKVGANALKMKAKYSLDFVMNQWHEFFQQFLK